MAKLLILIQSTIFIILSAVHVAWMLGSKWALSSALPTNIDGTNVLNPTKIDTAIVATGLLLFAIFYLVKGNYLKISFPNWIHKYVGWLISTLFLFRAMGDFNYVGFFKEITTTEFAQLDTILYTPLCLGLGVIGITIELTTSKK